MPLHFFVITKVVSCLGTDSSTALDIQLETRRTKVNFKVISTLAWWLYVHYSAGEDGGLCGLAKQRVPVLELSPNESLQSPQLKTPALILFLFSWLIQLSPCLTTRWPSSPPTRLHSFNSQPLSARDTIHNLFWLPQLTYDPFLPCPCFRCLQLYC